MTVIENHSVYPTREVKMIVRRILREYDLDKRDGLLVRVKHHGGTHAYQGRWYGNPHTHGNVFLTDDRGDWVAVGPSVPRGIDAYIVCRIAKPEANAYPGTHHKNLRGGPPPNEVATWQEALVAITAHEAYHVHQWDTEYQRLRLGKPRQSEVECEWAESRSLKRWKEDKS